MTEILWWLLLPVAAWAGWWFARRSTRRSEKKRNRVFNNQYFQGLNYLLNEQPDKAIEVFLEMAEVNRDTVETHLALGSLFRRRGEVDRAIRLHQNIISKRNLDSNQRTLALLELGEDYMRAGLFDRAERLFSELSEDETHVPSALRNLLDIYQQERDWEKALEIARKLESLDDQSMGIYRSHFCCELAEAESGKGRIGPARKHLHQARRHDPQSIRAEMIAADIARRAKDYGGAMDCYERIAGLDQDFLPDLISPYFECAEMAGQVERATNQLAAWGRSYDGISVALKQAELLERSQGAGRAAELLFEILREKPSVRGAERFIELRKAAGADAGPGEEILRSVLRRLLRDQSTYRCSHCGFSGHEHHWQCPSCRQWSTTRVIRGVLGE